MANNFLQFDSNKLNIMSDVDYSSDTSRQDGVSSGIASPSLHNKLFYQVSTMVKALADFIVAQGYDATDTSLSTLTTNLTSALTPISELTGVCKMYWGSSAPTGYVLADGKTIGSAASSATSRANSDTELLYTLLWNATNNTELPIQNSAGSATSRGASAAADFVANKRLPLPDMRGRVGIGKDDMGGTAASRITGASDDGANSTSIAGAGGDETHTLSADEMPAHTHGTTYTQQAGTAGGTNTASSLLSSASTKTSTSTGGGAAHSNTQPWIASNYIIKL